MPGPLRRQGRDKATILIRHGKLVQGSGEATPGVTAVATYRMEVTGKSRDGYRILWTPQSLEFEGIPRADAAQLKAIAAGSTIPFEFDADRSGRPLKITNRERALEMALAMVDKFPNIDPKIIDQTRAMFTSMDERTLAAVLGEEAGMLACRQRADLAIGKTNVLEELRANPFGGGQLKATVKADAVSAGPASLKVDWRTELDGKQMLADMIAAFKKIASQSGRPPAEVDAQLGDAELTFQETGNAEVGRADGWTRQFALKRLVRIAAPTRTENRDEFYDIKLTRTP